MLHKRPEAVSDRDIEDIFGSGWDRPATWEVLDFNIGQEAHAIDYYHRVLIGGGVKEIKIVARAKGD
jgi:hypothetical protein